MKWTHHVWRFSVSWWSQPFGRRNIPIPETEPSPNCNESKGCICWHWWFSWRLFHDWFDNRGVLWRAIVCSMVALHKIHAIHLGMRRKVHWNQHRSKWHCPVDTSAQWWAMVLPTPWERRLFSSTLGRIEEQLQEIFPIGLGHSELHKAAFMVGTWQQRTDR